MAYGTVNADVIGTSVAGSNLGAGNASIMKNRIINGAMVIDQRNAGASFTPTTSSTYTVDRWSCYPSQASKLTVQQNAGSVTPPAGFKNYVGVTVGASANVTLGASDIFQFYQTIEGYNVANLNYGTANAQTVTISFWVRSSLTGTFSGSVYSSSVMSYPFTYTISAANTWEQKSITIAGTTAYSLFSSTNGAGLTLTFDLGAGSTYTNTAGAWVAGTYTKATGSVSLVTTNSATFYITGVQLEVGSSATGFEYVNYQTSLANCQRYYSTGRVIARTSMYNVAQSGNDSIEATGFHKVTMRGTPTIATTNNTSGTITVPTITNEIASINKLGVFGTNLDVSYTASAEL